MSSCSPNRFLWAVTALIVILAISQIPSAAAFGAGNIPSYSALEGKAFRHGDIADMLSKLSKGGSGMFSSGSKFTSLDIKRIYFGNFLCDYSQAMDVAGLEKMSKQTILTIVMVLSFMAHGYATGEFEVTDERLGVYRCEQHLDNPSGYGDGKNPPALDPRLRGPVDPRETEIDPRSGAKNYLFNESGGWSTGSGLARDTITQVIQLGRQAKRSGDKNTRYEAFRLLGKAMHIIEDFPAHSNFCELALLKLGYRNVFCHVGEQVRVRSPDGQMVPPLVTGTFGGADFIHSVLGETTDHLSSAAVTDLNNNMNQSQSSSGGKSSISQLVSLLQKIPGQGGVAREAEDISRVPTSQEAQSLNPQELYRKVYKILAFHDKVVQSISGAIEKVPGLSSLIETASNTAATFTMTLIEPFIRPLVKGAISTLHTASGAAVSSVDQYKVFDNPNASDPTHSQLSKDHFALILNEVAGNVAIIMDRHLVQNVVAAWEDERMDARQQADACLAPLFHPFWQHPNSDVQREMMNYISAWAQGHPREVERLDKAHCRAHTNTRDGQVSNGGCGHGYASAGAATQNVGYGPQLAHQVTSMIGFRGIDGQSEAAEVAEDNRVHGPSRSQFASDDSANSYYDQSSSYDASRPEFNGRTSSYASPSEPPYGQSNSYAPPSSPPYGQSISYAPPAGSPYGAPPGPPPPSQFFPGGGGGGGGYGPPPPPPPGDFGGYGGPPGPPPQGRYGGGYPGGDPWGQQGGQYPQQGGVGGPYGQQQGGGGGSYGQYGNGQYNGQYGGPRF